MPAKGVKCIFFGKFFSSRSGKIKYHKKDNGKNEWRTKTAFTDNRSQRCSDKKQYKTGKGKNDLMMPFYFMFS